MKYTGFNWRRSSPGRKVLTRGVEPQQCENGVYCGPGLCFPDPHIAAFPSSVSSLPSNVPILPMSFSILPCISFSDDQFSSLLGSARKRRKVLSREEILFDREEKCMSEKKNYSTEQINARQSNKNAQQSKRSVSKTNVQQRRKELGRKNVHIRGVFYLWATVGAMLFPIHYDKCGSRL